MKDQAIQTVCQGNRFEIVLPGAVKAAQAGAFLEAARAAASSGLPVLVNWKETERLDASAFQVILALRRKAGASRFRVSTPSAALEKWIEVSGLGAEFPSATEAGH
jgi:anti-anti-sigma regulatory factor